MQLEKHPQMPYRNRHTIRRLILSGKLKAVVRGTGKGRRYLIPESSVDDYIANVKKEGSGIWKRDEKT